MMRPIAALKLPLACLLASAVGIANADECLSDWFTKSAPLVAKKDSWQIAQTQASNTWEDWVFRGPIFFCSYGGGNCKYSWSKSATAGYSWAVGVKIGIGNVPLVGKVLGTFEVNSTYTQQRSWTETFGWEQTISPGQYAQPVQVVVRRWTQGYFRGADRLIANSNCNGGEGSWYWWDGNATFGSWSANLEVNRFVKYHIYK